MTSSNLAREAGRIVDWRERFWGRRYRAIEISDEEQAQVSRLRYVLSHGLKENLVLRCRDWPGLQCIDAVTEGQPLEGFWHDRSLEYEANRRGKAVDPDTFIERYTLELDPLPCWRHLPTDEIRRRITEMVDEIERGECPPSSARRRHAARRRGDPQTASARSSTSHEEVSGASGARRVEIGAQAVEGGVSAVRGGVS
ncbi:MAG: hypothetical protein GY719_11080 [bacterium]|nr:hypothetical protein [bacterium]